MKRPGKTIRRLVAALMVGPPLIWGLILVFLPMDWARQKIVSKLEAETGQEVRLGRVRLRALGGVRLDDLQFAVHGSSDDPWLKVGSLVIDVKSRDLLCGTISPTNAKLSGVALRVRRDRDGRLELEDLFQKKKQKVLAIEASATSENTALMSFQIENTSVTILDETTDTRLEMTGIDGRGNLDCKVATIEQMTGTLNGGAVEMAARADLTGGRMAFESEIHLENVALGVGMKSLSFAIPLLAQAGNDTAAEGKLTMELFVKSRGDTSDTIARALTGQGGMTLADLSLEHSRLLEEVTRHLPIHAKARIGSLRGGFTIGNRRVSTDDTVLQIADLPISLTGWSDFDGQLLYQVKCESLGKKVHSLAEKLPTEAREFLYELPVDRLDGLVNLEISGTIDNPIVRAREGSLFSKKNGPLANPARRGDGRVRIREAGKRVIDRLVR